MPLRELDNRGHDIIPDLVTRLGSTTLLLEGKRGEPVGPHQILARGFAAAAAIRSYAIVLP